MASPQPQPSYYASDAVGTETLRRLGKAARYNRWLLERIDSAIGERVVEVGCGTGTITQMLLGRELVVAVDVEPQFIAQLRNRHSTHPELVAVNHDLSSGPGDLARYRPDSAISINVFEHIEDDVAAMHNIYRILRPGGRFGLIVPAHPFLSSGFDDSIGHHRRYRKRELGKKLEAAGFVVERLRRSNLIGGLGWLVLVRLLRRPQLEGVGLFDRLVPALRKLDRIEPPFGLSLVAVGRKPLLDP